MRCLYLYKGGGKIIFLPFWIFLTLIIRTLQGLIAVNEAQICLTVLLDEIRYEILIYKSI